MDRVTKITIRGEVGDILGKLSAVSSATKATVASMVDGSKESAAFRQNLTALGNTAGKFGLVAAGGVALAVRAFANFDEAMAAVSATGEDARGSLDALREAAVAAGARTKFSATEAAGAIENLAKAGVSAGDILSGGLNGALDLAAAGNLDVAQAAEIAATSMNQFGLAGSDVPHIADVISAAAGKAAGEVSDMGLAFSYVGPVASQMGVSIEETAGAIAFLSQSGVGGEKAGNALRGMLTSLTSPSKVAADTMAELGINMYTASGEFIGLQGLAGALQTSLGGLGNAERDAALGRIFGNEQITAARILYEGGADAVRKWTTAVDDQGYAAETSALKLNSLKGDLELLSGSLETALIGTGEGANGPLRELVQLLGGAVDAYNELPGPIKNVVLATAGLTAGIGGTVFVASRAIEGFANLNKSLDGVGLKFEGANKKALLFQRGGALALGGSLMALSGPIHKVDENLGTLTDAAGAAAMGFAVAGPWGAAIGGGISLLSSLGGAGNDAAVDLSGLTSTLDQQTGAIGENTAAWAATQLQNSGAAAWLDAVGVDLTTATEAVLGNKDAMNELTEAADGLGIMKDKVLGPVNKMADAVDDEGKKLANTTEATNGLTDGVTKVGAASRDTAGQVESLKKELDGLLSPMLDQDQATVAWRLSLMSLGEDLSKQGRTLDLNTKSGLENRNAIRDRVEALQASAAADAEAGVEAEKVGSKLKRGAESIIDAGVAANISEKEMRRYLRQLDLTPESIDTLIKAQDFATPKVDKVKTGLGILDGVTASPRIALAGAGAAQSAINGVSVGLAFLPKTKTITIITRNKTENANGGVWDYYADGGTRGGSENHVAQIAPAGSMRVWAEPETGGEAYIPLAASKRPRSRTIAEQTVGLLGGSVEWFANGGITPASPLELKQQEKTIRDIERSLAEREKFGKKPKKGRDTRPSRNVLRGLDRQIALLELAEAKQDLRDLKSGKESRLEAREKAKQDAIDAANDAESSRLSAKGSYAQNFTLGGATTAASLERNLERTIADARTFMGLLGDLKAQGASPWLLAQLVEAGPTRSAIKLAREYATDSSKLASINAKAGQIDALTNQYASLVGSANFLNPAAWNTGISSASMAPAAGAQVQIDVHPSQGMSETQLGNIVGGQLAWRMT